LATITNLYVDQGTTFETIVDVTNQDGTPLNLSGYTVVAQMRKSYQSSSSTSFNASVFGDPENGQISLTLDPEDTSGMRAGRYLYDVEISASGKTYRALEGIVLISPEITR
jgi:FlaG/FlaF family flagellin (archaellin)